MIDHIDFNNEFEKISKSKPKVLIIDNYDSFTYNIVQLLMKLNVFPQIISNDQFTLDEIKLLSFTHLILSPGPGHPLNAGVTLEAIKYFSGKNIPILGICLGHQAIALAFGGVVESALQINHGKIAKIENSQIGLFSKLPKEFNVTRYHSLIVNEQLPNDLMMTAWTRTSDNQIEVMGIQHKTLPIYGVQFHPEAILSEFGTELILNFLTCYD